MGEAKDKAEVEQELSRKAMEHLQRKMCAAISAAHENDTCVAAEGVPHAACRTCAAAAEVAFAAAIDAHQQGTAGGILASASTVLQRAEKVSIEVTAIPAGTTVSQVVTTICQEQLVKIANTLRKAAGAPPVAFTSTEAKAPVVAAKRPMLVLPGQPGFKL